MSGSVFSRAKRKLPWRRLTQLVVLILFILFLVRTKFPGPGKLISPVFFRLDLFLAVTSFFSSGYRTGPFWPLLFLVIAVVVFGNFFCFWICPVGSSLEFAGFIFCRRRWRVGWKLPFWFRYFRFLLLGLMILISPFSLVGKLPYLAWLFDPFVITVRALVFGGGWLVFLLVLFVFSITFPRGWCFNFCPLGAFYTLIGRIYPKPWLRQGKQNAAHQSERIS